MKKDKLMQLALQMTNGLNKFQERKLASSKRFINKTEEFNEKIEAFEGVQNILNNI